MLNLVKKIIIIVFFIVTLYFLFSYFFTAYKINKTTNKKSVFLNVANSTKKEKAKNQIAKKETAKNQKAKNQIANQQKTKPISYFLTKESNLVGQLTAEPKKTLKRLQQRAKLLKTTDFNYLLKESLSTNLNGDRRFLSVHLISLSGQAKALPYLDQIISKPIHKTEKTTGLYEQELLIKMQAAEAFIKLLHTGKTTGQTTGKTTSKTNIKKTMQNLLAKQEDPFLVKFIRSSINKQ